MDETQKRRLILYAVFAVIFAFAGAFVYAAPPGKPAPGQGLRLLAGFVAVPTSFLGVWMADALRRFVMPDAIMTNGGFFDLLKARLFWTLGPQAIGLFIGTGVGLSLVL